MKREKILIVGNYGPDAQKSMVAYTEMLAKGLRDAGVDVTVISPMRILGKDEKSSSGVWKWIAYIDKFVIFSVLLLFKQLRYSRVHVCDHSNGMYGFVLWGRHSTITCHDVIAIQAAKDQIDGWAVSRSGKVFQYLIVSGMRRFDKIYCASRLTMNDLQSLGYKFNAVVAENALNGDFAPPGIDRDRSELERIKNSFPANYFLHVGSDLPRKNRDFLLEVMYILKERKLDKDFDLVLVGPNPSIKTKGLLEKYGIANKVHYIQNVAHEDLVLLYGYAGAFIFPSLNEGFGWPVAEAQACGCPVIASNREPMPEVGGDGALYFSPTSPRECADILMSADLGSLRQKGIENSRRFGVKEMLKKMDFI